MLNNLILIKKYFNYLFNAKTRHGIHSPFVYKLIEDCIYNKNYFEEFKIIERIRKDLIKSSEVIEITDFGAGSKINNTNKRAVSDIAKKSAKNEKYGKLLFNLCMYFQPQKGLELGTSLGISALYQVFGSKKMTLITLEGCPNTSKIAQQIFKNAGLNNIEIRVGDFNKTFPEELSKIENLDYVFFDGNHQEEPTINYFEDCLRKVNNDTFFVFDDIHWSEGMEKAWDYVKNHSKVTISIDLFMVGIVFFRKEQPKQHFVVRY
ncbi:MAG: class I SAM-dependent methyltransferase [Bacteroidota bacterium]